jgi:hypothetical protein
VVFRGTLQVEASDHCELLDVAAKLRSAHRQRETPQNEYGTYRRLDLIGTGVTAPLGFFDDSEIGPSALVTPRVGPHSAHDRASLAKFSPVSGF